MFEFRADAGRKTVGFFPAKTTVESRILARVSSTPPLAGLFSNASNIDVLLRFRMTKRRLQSPRSPLFARCISGLIFSNGYGCAWSFPKKNFYKTRAGWTAQTIFIAVRVGGSTRKSRVRRSIGDRDEFRQNDYGWRIGKNLGPVRSVLENRWQLSEQT